MDTPFAYGFEFDQRLDGTPKGPGFATQTLPDGSVMTEYSAGGNGDMLYPLVYQGIMPWEMQTLANDAQYGYDPLFDDVAQAAYLQAIVRAGQGLSPFWQMGEPMTGLNYTPRNR